MRRHVPTPGICIFMLTLIFIMLPGPGCADAAVASNANAHRLRMRARDGRGMDMLRLGLKSDGTGSTHMTTVIASTATTLTDRNRHVRRLVESRLTTSCQLVLATRSRTRVPGHQIPGATGQRGSGFSAPNDFSEQHPCKQQHSTPEGGMCKKRLHVDHPELPLRSLGLILASFHVTCISRRQHRPGELT